jgi:hypothetical protein
MAAELRNDPAQSSPELVHSCNRRFSMKLVTAMSAAMLVLAPAVALAQNPADDAGGTQNQSGLKSKVEQFIGKVTGTSPDNEKESANAKGGENSAAKGDTDYPDRAAIKRTDK